MEFRDIAQPVTGLLNSILQNKFAKEAQERQNAANLKMADYTYSKDLEQWNRMNEYNNPANQMQRFTEAGLNPNLIYGKGTAGNATVLPKYNTPTVTKKSFVPDISGVIPSYQDYQLKEAQVDIATNQARLLEEKALTESVNRGMKSLNYQWMTTPMAGGRKTNQFALWDTKANLYDQRLITQKRANMLANYNWQIAEQNLFLKKKENQYYMWKHLYGPLGGTVIKGAGNAFKFLRGGKNIGRGKLTTPNYSKGGLGPRGFKGKSNMSVNDWYGYQRKFTGW